MFITPRVSGVHENTEAHAGRTQNSSPFLRALPAPLPGGSPGRRTRRLRSRRGAGRSPPPVLTSAKSRRSSARAGPGRSSSPAATSAASSARTTRSATFRDGRRITRGRARRPHAGPPERRLPQRQLGHANSPGPLDLRGAEDRSRPGAAPAAVFNCGGYERVEILRLLEGRVEIYMPDAKFLRPETAARYSTAPDYPDAMKAALREMHRQVGDLEIRDGLAVKGLLVRHLVMPGSADESMAILDFIAREISPNTYVNVMDQYHPAGRAREVPGNLPPRHPRRIPPRPPPRRKPRPAHQRLTPLR